MRARRLDHKPQALGIGRGDDQLCAAGQLHADAARRQAPVTGRKASGDWAAGRLATGDRARRFRQR